jgi:hypothetical protein
LQANLEEIKLQEKESRSLMAKAEKLVSSRKAS